MFPDSTMPNRSISRSPAMLYTEAALLREQLDDFLAREFAH